MTTIMIATAVMLMMTVMLVIMVAKKTLRKR